MREIKRFHIPIWVGFRADGNYMDESDDGDYVLYSDHLAAMEEKDREIAKLK